MIIKNTWDKIYFHPLFYVVGVISLLTGHFRNIFYVTIIILVHELGHSLTGILLKMNLNRIEIYPYGGCSKLSYDINIELFKELIMLLMGPIVQIVFTYFVYYFKIDVEKYFYTYSVWILIFNLLPIYPLDGGKLLHIIFSYFISFYNSLKFVYYISYFFFFILFFLSLFEKNLIIVLITISLGIELFKQFKNISHIFYKFLLERYLNNYHFKRIKRVNNVYKMKRDYEHIFCIKNMIFNEQEYLKKYFTFYEI